MASAGPVRSLYQGIQADVRVGSSLSGSFEVKNGLRQGCTLVPTLFNIYFSAVGDRTAKSRLNLVRVSDGQLQYWTTVCSLMLFKKYSNHVKSIINILINFTSFDLNVFGPLPVISAESAPGML